VSPAVRQPTACGLGTPLGGNELALLTTCAARRIVLGAVLEPATAGGPLTVARVWSEAERLQQQGHGGTDVPRVQPRWRVRWISWRALRNGDRKAFEELYNLYHRRMARFLTRLTHRYDLAEEVINDTFWVVWRKARDFRGDSQPSTWILGIAYRKAAMRCAPRALRTPEPGGRVPGTHQQ